MARSGVRALATSSLGCEHALFSWIEGSNKLTDWSWTLSPLDDNIFRHFPICIHKHAFIYKWISGFETESIVTALR